MTDVVAVIEKQIVPGTVIPKPQARGDFVIKGWGIRRGERALIYTIPNHRTPSKPYEKGVTVSEWRQAFAHLISHGNFSRAWFNETMRACAKEGGCNFTSIGDLFVLLRYATHERGEYRNRTVLDRVPGR